MSQCVEINLQMANPVVLDFHNCLLRKSDLKLLEHPNWLNDNLINFAFEYFEYNAFDDHADEVAFVGPDTVQFLKLGSEDDIVPCIQSLNLSTKQLIVFAINDSAQEQDSGSHWSTLIFKRATGSFQHYDSYASSNKASAKSVAWIVHDHIKSPGAPSMNASSANFPFEEMPCPQQANGCDCGMYVVCLTELIANHVLNGKRLSLETVTPKTVKEARSTWKSKILQLKDKQ